MKVIGVQVTDEGDISRVQLTVGDDSGNQATYQYSGHVYTTLNSSSKGNVSIYVNVNTTKVDSVTSNSPNSRFDS